MTIEAALALHTKVTYNNGDWCEHCHHFFEAGPWIDNHHIEDDARWPCPTVRALTGQVEP